MVELATAPAGRSPAESARKSTLWRFVARRLGRVVISFAILVSVAFFMLRLTPGDPIRAALGPTAPQQLVDARREQLGLDLPLWDQYLTFWREVLTGDLGDSFSSRIPVVDLIAQRLPATVELASLAVVVALVVSVPLGIAIASLTRAGQRRRLELGYSALAGFFAVVPEFVVGVLLVYVFAVQTQLLPVAGRGGPVSYLMPVIALSIGGIASLSRIVRVEALTVLDQEYMRTALAKRMSRMRRYLVHVLPNVLTSALTIGGLAFGALIAGTVLVETVFSWPGLGQLVVRSIREGDYPLAQGVVIVYGTIVLLVTLLVDLTLMALDRRSSLRTTS